MSKKAGNCVINSLGRFKNKSLSNSLEVGEVKFRQQKDVHELSALTWLKIQRYDGETREGQSHGEGAASFEGGHVYQGKFSEGLMDGSGIFTLTNGLKYEGEFVCNMPMGQGTYTWPDGSTYTGEVYKGKRHGTGTYKCTKHGVSYTGQWHEGRRHGKGTVYYNVEKTSWYKGDWVMNNREGSGERCYPSGNIYSGEWKNNVRHGEGTMSWVNVGQRYVGKWEHGVQHGRGRHFWILKRVDGSQYSQSNQYEGDFFNGLRHGEGTFYYAGGAIYKGEWKNNKKHGQGTFTAEDGRVFEGEFVDDRMMIPEVFPASESDSSILGPDMALNIECLLEKIPERNREMEREQVEFVVMREDVNLRLIYRFYSRLGCSRSPDNTFLLSRLQFWRLLKDCNVHHHGITLTQIDCFIREDSLTESHSPFTPMLLRELLRGLVIVAYYIYHKDTVSENPLLAACLSKLLTHNILPNARNVKGFLFRQPEFALEAVKYMKRSWEAFETFCKTSHRDDKTMTCRQLMWMFKDLGLFDHQLTSTRLLEILSAENCDPNNQTCVELEITFLEFFEVLVGSAEVKHHQVSEDDQVLLRSDCQDRENLSKVDTDKKERENITARDVTGHRQVRSQDEEIPQAAEQNHEGQDPISGTEAKTQQLQHRIRTIQQFFDHFFAAVDHHQQVTRKMLLKKTQNSQGQHSQGKNNGTAADGVMRRET